ncbi:Rho GTPase activator [Grosmannia clavigera kw1407]|uniref:Rho GTPase activator n=1 Tax=Grosmannia clavigera (strain kw1407 / UAMH 11150) TaxID=655863 RepID=F0XRC0_GROCL|nr:Rho GTPase activator [Grosmannia clavigera kw1407]EFW99697.1 Rho GTPase activator [Grosmannia clavigera kw1407]
MPSSKGNETGREAGNTVRKTAPQPLALAESALMASDRSLADASLQIDSPAEYSIHSRSPRSPNSPLRYNDRSGSLVLSQTPVPAGKPPVHLAELISQPLADSESSHHPSLSTSTSSSQLQQPAQPPQQPPQQHQQKHYGHGRHRQNEDKTSKSNFFFHFDAEPTQAANSAELPTRSNASLVSSSTEAEISSSNSRKGKPKSFGRLGRTRSNRDKNGNIIHSNTTTATNTPASSMQDDASMRMVEPPERAYQPAATLKPAAVMPHEPSHREAKASRTRNHSAERVRPRDVPSTRDGHQNKQNQTREREHVRAQPSSSRETGGYTFFSGLKNSRAADIFSKGFFGKSTRSGSTTEREPVVDDEHYVLRVINRPLVEQTRMTRISKRLEDSRDKTEFWMPAFPWRAIDYLNFKGTDVEGLYRVPGSGPQIKKWQRKFDQEHDVDLLSQDDLYDINIIGSMLKAWLRELPDELFPKAAQERVARQCAGSERVPQLLIDELSDLSPFNYYLLFAITCHLSLLLAHSDKNKMDYRNLCICFQPCMKIDAFSFKFLVCDWRDCWQGCRNEMRYIEEEYRIFGLPPPMGISTPRSQLPPGSDGLAQEQVADMRQISSSDSDRQLDQVDQPPLRRPPNMETGSVASTSTISTTLTIDSQRAATPPGQSGEMRGDGRGQMRPLSPIKPLSPLGF